MNENNQEFQLWNIEKKALLLMLDSLMEMKSQYEEGIEKSINLQKEVDALESIRRTSQRYMEKLEFENRDLRKRIKALHQQLYENTPAIISESGKAEYKTLNTDFHLIVTPFGTIEQFKKIKVQLAGETQAVREARFFVGYPISYADEFLEIDVEDDEAEKLSAILEHFSEKYWMMNVEEQTCKFFLARRIIESVSVCEDESKDSNAIQLVKASPVETPHGTFRQFELVDIELGSASGISEEDSLELEGLLVSYEPSDDLLEFDFIGCFCGAGDTRKAFNAFDEKISEKGFKEETTEGVAYFIPSNWVVAIKKAHQREINKNE